MCGADAQVGDPAGKVWLVGHLGYHHLGRAGPGGRGRGARAAVVHDGGHPAEQGLLVEHPHHGRGPQTLVAAGGDEHPGRDRPGRD